MNYRTKVTIEVINEEGHVVTHRGHAHGPKQATNDKLSSFTHVTEHDEVGDALNALNAIHRVVVGLKDLKEQKNG